MIEKKIRHRLDSDFFLKTNKVLANDDFLEPSLFIILTGGQFFIFTLKSEEVSLFHLYM